MKWSELIKRFEETQEKARKSQRLASMGEDAGASPVQEKEKPPEVPPKAPGLRGPPPAGGRPLPAPAGQPAPGHKPRSSLNLGRFAGGGLPGRKKK